MVLHIDGPSAESVTPDFAAHPQLAARPHCLCRFDDGTVFAYLERGNEFMRTSDHELWATERNDVLVSARSGLPLAYRRGRVYFAAETDEPLFYERAV